MRALLAAPSAALAVLLAAVAPALAQDTDMPGCIQANPCEVVVDLQASGIADLEPASFTRGDWVQLDVFNGDEVEHTLTVEGKGVSVTVGPDDINASRPFEFGAVGTVTLRDSPTGDTWDVTVEAEESFSGNGATGSGKGTPGLAPLALFAALVVAAAVLRRRA